MSPSTVAAPSVATSAASPTASASVVAPAAPAPAESRALTGSPCGALDCLAFDSPEAAFDHVLASQPLVLAVGEAHAQKGTESIPSATLRFSTQLLPRLSGRARGLLVELLVPDPKCKKKTVARVQQQQRPATLPQAESNQSEFLQLAERAKQLGIPPLPLFLSCDELDAITRAGAGDIDRMLVTVTQISLKTLNQMLDRAPPPAPSNLVLAYGGAIHNDLLPRKGRESWSFGPALQERTHAYVELDLIVPEYVKDSEAWRALPWYADFSSQKPSSRTLLYQPSPSSFVLIFPWSAP